MLLREAVAKRVEGTRSDVAVNDAEGAEGEGEEVTLAVLLL
jgi:hypothetical protein